MNLSALLPKPKYIIGCVDPTPLLERYTLLKTPWGQLRLHHFLRSDEDRELHDHPWAFVTLILRGGYVEEIPTSAHRANILRFGAPVFNQAPRTERHARRPGSILYRPSRWAHRVEIAPGTDAWTLIWMSRKSREWGFLTPAGWVDWRQYHATAACRDDDAKAAM